MTNDQGVVNGVSVDLEIAPWWSFKGVTQSTDRPSHTIDSCAAVGVAAVSSRLAVLRSSKRSYTLMAIGRAPASTDTEADGGRRRACIMF